MNDIPYGFSKRLPNTSFHVAVEGVTEALKSEGFGVLTKIDVKQTLKDKLGVDFRNYVILGACNPTLANKALDSEPHIGLLLPCNVVVQEVDGGDIEVSVADPKAMFTLVENQAAASIATEADERLRRMIDSL